MRHSLKKLSMALFAIIALSAVTASAAQAETEFVSGAEHSTVKAVGTGNQIFTLGSTSVVCTGYSAEGTMKTAKATEISFKPVSSGCSMGMFGVDFDYTECDRLVTGASGEVHLVKCPAGKHLDIIGTALGIEVCRVTVLLGSTVKESEAFSNGTSGKKMDVTAVTKVTGVIPYEEEAGGMCGVGAGNNGSFHGNATFTAFDTKGQQVDLTVN